MEVQIFPTPTELKPLMRKLLFKARGEAENAKEADISEGEVIENVVIAGMEDQETPMV